MSPHLDQIKVGQSIKEGPSTVEKADVQQVAASHLHSKKAIYEDAFVLVNAHGEAGEHAERKLIRKVDWFLMPLVSFSRYRFSAELIVRIIDVLHIRIAVLRQSCHRSCCGLRSEGRSWPRKWIEVFGNFYHSVRWLHRWGLSSR